MIATTAFQYVMARRDLAARELLAVLIGQHLQFKLRAGRVAPGAQPVDAMRAVVTHSCADLLLGHRPPLGKKLRATFTGQKALCTTSSLNSVLYFFMDPLRFVQRLGRQFKPAAIQGTVLQAIRASRTSSSVNTTPSCVSHLNQNTLTQRSAT